VSPGVARSQAAAVAAATLPMPAQTVKSAFPPMVDAAHGERGARDRNAGRARQEGGQFLGRAGDDPDPLHRRLAHRSLQKKSPPGP
jgi:hypothetical protein